MMDVFFILDTVDTMISYLTTKHPVLYDLRILSLYNL